MGFPGETPEDFEQTIDLLDEVQYDAVFGFKNKKSKNGDSKASDLRMTRIPLNRGAGRMPALGFGTLIPDAALTITTNSLPSWTVGTPGYDQFITATNGTIPVTFSVSAGSLPAGLNLNTSTGEITGEARFSRLNSPAR